MQFVSDKHWLDKIIIKTGGVDSLYHIVRLTPLRVSHQELIELHMESKLVAFNKYNIQLMLQCEQQMSEQML